jgi:ketosteroid isomerase-like protein
VTQTDEFLRELLPHLRRVETALHQGDAGPRIALWSHTEPVTLLGARFSAIGWAQIEQVFDDLAPRFSNGSFDIDVIAAGANGDLAYMVGIEHTTASVGGAEPEAYELRVTEVFRREQVEWKVVHRHADPMPDSDAARRQLDRLGET